jgi:hypothetical protein
VVDPHFSIESYSQGAAPIAAAWYLAAADRWGSPADTPEEIERRPEATRELVDAVLVDAMQLAATRTTSIHRAGTAPDVSAVRGGSVARNRSCVRLDAGSASASVDLVLRRPAVAVTAGGGAARLLLRRFADRFRTSLGVVAAGSTVRVALPPDPAPAPWRLRIRGAGVVTACSVR